MSETSTNKRRKVRRVKSKERDEDKPRKIKRVKKKIGRVSRPDPAKLLKSALDNITLRGRAYRLTFGNLGDKRSLSAEERAAVMRKVEENVHTTKTLFNPDDPFLKVQRRDRDNLRAYFRSLTIAHPEPGVRLFVLREGVRKWSDMSAEELEQEMAQQLDAFHTDMNARIEAYVNGAVKAVIDNYDEILESSAEYLGELYDPTQYPDKSELDQLIYVKFHPIPSVLPPEYDRIDPTMRQHVTEFVREQMEASLASQIKNVSEALNDSLQGLQERVSAIGTDNAGRFYQSRVSNVLEAIQQYDTTMQSMGISLGGGLSSTLRRLQTAITDAGSSPDKVIQTLRSSNDTRDEILSQLKVAILRSGRALKPLQRQID